MNKKNINKLDDSKKQKEVGTSMKCQSQKVFDVIKDLLDKKSAVFILVVLCAFFTIINPSFLSLENIKVIASRSAVPLVLSMGMTFVILLGGIDLSVPGIMSVGSLVVALLVSNNRNSNDFGFFAIIVAVAVGLLLGFINGYVHTKFKNPSFMVTLGMFSFSYGIAMLLSGGSPPKILDEGLRTLGIGHFAGFVWLVYVSIVLILISYILQNYTKFGRYAYVIGGNEEIANQCGINVSLYKILVFTFAGGMYALGGVMETARLGLGHSLIGDGQDFATITAVVIGGTMLSGGRGGVLNSVIGVLIMSVLADGLILIDVNPYIQNAVQGLIILIAVISSTWQQRKRLRIMK
jgi:ribose transport system permease protein